jgi:hypothetical protein
MVDPFALVDRNRLDRRDVFRELHDQFLRRGSDLRNGIDVVVLEVNLILRPRGLHFDLAAIDQFHCPGAIEHRVETGFPQRLADHVAGKRFRAVGFASHTT